jgi:hypothetical protein
MMSKYFCYSLLTFYLSCVVVQGFLKGTADLGHNFLKRSSVVGFDSRNLQGVIDRLLDNPLRSVSFRIDIEGRFVSPVMLTLVRPLVLVLKKNQNLFHPQFGLSEFGSLHLTGEVEGYEGSSVVLSIYTQNLFEVIY